ncbi:MAG TPA: hypothetical protein PLZ45_07265, partial [Ferruginibacter sp.]|nr:hypothetical protein [Chitinophagaceae bacterium]HRI24460.1 hypothetical protein [Ferruginibacter sp.]
LFSGAHGKSLKPLFQLFLYSTDKLEISVKQTADDKYLVKLLNIDMPLPVEVDTDSGTQRLTLEKKPVTLTSKTPLQVDPKGFYLKKVILE